MTAINNLPDYLTKSGFNDMRNKFGAKKQNHPDWGVFDSMGEMNHYAFLITLEISKEISNLERQVRYDIVINGVKVCWIKPDYRYEKDGKIVVSDFKGMLLPEAKLKFKLLKAVHGVDVLIVKKPGEKY